MIKTYQNMCHPETHPVRSSGCSLQLTTRFGGSARAESEGFSSYEAPHELVIGPWKVIVTLDVALVRAA